MTAEPLAGTLAAESSRHWRVIDPVAWPTPVRTFLAKVNTSAGWRCYTDALPDVFAGRGTLTQGGLSEDTDGDGRRHRVIRTVWVDSYRATVRHEQAGLRAYALWARPDGGGWATQGGEVASLCLEPGCAHCARVAPVTHALAYPRQVKLAELAALVASNPLEEQP